ncbi:cytochrome P450 [Neolentinus lepideus HHB14362 ss-1]|uniref:Cytochrome P450 n=1 Tax=Neolentinus lepideus HHB14362 ss-1 TaxID=1314782 RepID=A0A165VIE8_9AGAM|nr:cytochrome P450 [Neolentinus lepideus HHB14362 ss-1]
MSRFRATGYQAGLFGSMLVYRMLLHPLRAYPGPFSAKLTNFWCLKETTKGNKWHKQVKELHNQYGESASVGSREISICHPEAVQDVHGYKSTCVKSINYPHSSLKLTRDKTFHSQRRKIWKRGFTDKVSHDEAVDWRAIECAMVVCVVSDRSDCEAAESEVGEVVWAAVGGAENVEKDLPYIFSYLVDDDSKRAKDPPFNQQDLVYDSDLAIFASSDTTSGPLTNIFFLLATHPAKLHLLQQDLDPLPTVHEISPSSLKGLPFLEGVSNEALRLFPPSTQRSVVYKE